MPATKKVTIRHVQGPPELTGDLSHPSWKAAEWNSDFVMAGDPERPAPTTTTFALIHDGLTLHGAVRVELPDSDAWQVQLILDSRGRHDTCAVFLFESNGLATASYIESANNETGYRFGGPWPGDVAYRVVGEGAHHVLQFSMRLCDFPRDADGCAGWPMNLLILPSVDHPDQWTSFAPVPDGQLPRFFLPQNQLVTTRFENPTMLARYGYSIARGRRGRVVVRESGTIYQQEIRLAVFDGAPREVELHAQLASGPTDVRTLTLPLSEEVIETVELPTAKDFLYAGLRLSLVEPDSEQLLCRQTILIEREPLSWKPHTIRRIERTTGRCVGYGDAQMRFVPSYRGHRVVPFGVAQMDNGEVILVGAAHVGLSGSGEQAVVAISGDAGATWSDYIRVPGCVRPMMLAHLGQGVVSFVDDGILSGVPQRLFSHDYGRTWTEKAPVPPAPDGFLWGVEGNALVDRDTDGRAVRIAEIGYTTSEGPIYFNPIIGWIRWSNDGGRTWGDASRPEAWRWQETCKGRIWVRGCCEGAMVRAANGWIVAALRTDPPARWLEHPTLGDNLEGTCVSISRDDGRTWSPLNMLFLEGRMHATLLRLPNDALVMTVIRRIDMQDGELLSYRKGCDALISHDHGLTWDEMVALDDFPYLEDELWTTSLACGHQFSTVLDDGSILTAFGNYLCAGELIKWRPEGCS